MGGGGRTGRPGPVGWNFREMTTIGKHHLGSLEQIAAATCDGKDCLAGVRGFSASMSGVYHVTVIFSGRVQGVGFRYQTLQVAKGYEVSGWVTNLSDGRVQLEAEGRPDEVRDFIVAIQERMEGYIRKVEQTETQRAPQYQGFSIR